MTTFALVTTKANSLIAKVHIKRKRMPVILTEELQEQWMQKDLVESRIRQNATFQYPSLRKWKHGPSVRTSGRERTPRSIFIMTSCLRLSCKGAKELTWTCEPSRKWRRSPAGLFGHWKRANHPSILYDSDGFNLYNLPDYTITLAFNTLSSYKRERPIIKMALIAFI